jgi:hypothetical protein
MCRLLLNGLPKFQAYLSKKWLSLPQEMQKVYLESNKTKLKFAPK